MKRDIELEATLVAKYAAVEPVLDERSRRRWAAAESRAIGYGGDAVVSSATGLARETIRNISLHGFDGSYLPPVAPGFSSPRRSLQVAGDNLPYRSQARPSLSRSIRR